MNPKINKNSHNIFLAIFLPSKWMPRSNKLVCTKKSNKSQKFCKSRNKISKSENPTNKKKKYPQIWFTKTKPKPRFCSHKHEKKKTQTQTHPVVGL